MMKIVHKETETVKVIETVKYGVHMLIHIYKKRDTYRVVTQYSKIQTLPMRYMRKVFTVEEELYWLLPGIVRGLAFKHPIVKPKFRFKIQAYYSAMIFSFMRSRFIKKFR